MNDLPERFVDDSMNLGYREAIESGCDGESVGAHVGEHKPVPDVEGRQEHTGHHLVQAITRRAPHWALLYLAGLTLLTTNIHSFNYRLALVMIHLV